MTGEPRSLWQAFMRAAEHEGRTALCLAGGDISFGALRRLAERVAAWLAVEGVGRGDLVAIHLPKRPETYALWLACLRQGCPYVFMDPANPPARTASILDRLHPGLLVTETETVNAHGRTLRLADAFAGQRWLDGLPDDEPPSEPALHGLDPAYVMFTSGSTGEPKGAVIPQQGVLSLMRWVRDRIGVAPPARFSNLNPLHFDNAVFDLYGGLLNGAALVPVETGRSPNPVHWVRRLREGGATVAFAVPTLFLTLDALKLLTPDSLPTIRVFVFGGEGFPAAPLGAMRSRFEGQARLVNVYGPTETSCICSSHEIDAAAVAAAGSGFPTLGRMHADFEHAILDENGEEVRGTGQGELWIGGPNVGLGYFANPEETERRFRQSPLQSAYRSVWYRTGDLVRQDAEGLLWFVGRIDNQVKIRGHRIELEEIDAALESIEGVSRAVTVAAAGPEGQELRAAFVADRKIEPMKLAAVCAARLPPYMRPQIIRQLDALPQNANGKVDRKAVRRLLEDG